MKMSVLNVTAVATMILAGLLLPGCSSYYVQHLESYSISPNSAPVATIDRKENDVRLAVGITGLPDNEMSFDNGDYSDREYYDTVSHTYRRYPEKDNIFVYFPYAQASLMLDYTVTKHGFVYCKGNAGYIEDRFCGGISVGVGLNFQLPIMTITGYFAPGVNTLNQDLIVSRYDYAESSGIKDSTLRKNCPNLGFGLQFTSNRKDGKLNFVFGVDAVLQNYISFDYGDYRGSSINYDSYYDDYVYYDDYNNDQIAYRLFYLMPEFGIIKQFGNSQLNAVFHIALPVKSSNTNDDYTYDDYYDDENESNALWKNMFTSLDITYTYTFRKKQ